MMRCRWALQGVALLPLLLAMSCASSQPGANPKEASSAESTKLDTDFVARAEAVCAPYAKYNATHYLHVKGFNRFVPNVDLLPRVAAYLSRNPSYRTLVPEMEALGPPDSGGAGWAAVMDDLRAGDKLFKKTIANARKGDGTGFTSSETLVEENITVLNLDLLKLGLSGQSSCYSVRGDPLRAERRHRE